MDLDQTIDNLKAFLSKKYKKYHIYRYSDTNDFKTLWDIGDIEEKKKLNLSNNNIVIIWDGYPKEKQPESDSSNTSSINFTSYLTPIDWAFAYSRWWLKEDRPKDKLTISILDVYSHRVSLKNMNFYTVALQSMKGWVNFYSFNKKDFPQAGAGNPLAIKERI